jgi:hypothetical protein
MIENIRLHLEKGFPGLLPEINALLGHGFHENLSIRTYEPLKAEGAEIASVQTETAGFSLTLSNSRRNFTQIEYIWNVNLACVGRTDVLSFRSVFMDLLTPSENYLSYFNQGDSSWFRYEAVERLSRMLAYALLFVEYKTREFLQNQTLELVKNLRDDEIADLAASFTKMKQIQYSEY